MEALVGLILRFRRVDHQSVQRRLHADLAAQAAVGFPWGGSGTEHRFLILGDRVQQWQEGLLHVHVTGGALEIAAAFGDDSVDTVLHGAFHDGVAHGHVYFVGFAGVRDVCDPGHVEFTLSPTYRSPCYASSRIHSCARVRISPSSGNRSPTMASESAPASRAWSAVARVMPPIATNGRVVSGRRRRNSSRPTTGSGFSFVAVPKMGPRAT